MAFMERTGNSSYRLLDVFNNTTASLVLSPMVSVKGTTRGVSKFVFFSIFLMMMALATCALNSFTIFVFAKMKSAKSFSEYFILCLAIADLSVGCVVMPVRISYLISQSLLHNPWLCSFSLASASICRSMSAFYLLLISLDRYMLAAKAIKYRLYKKKHHLWTLVCFPWIMIFLLHVVPISVSIGTQGTIYSGKICYQVRQTHYITILECISLFIPIIGVPFINCQIYHNLRGRFQRQSIRKFTSPSLDSGGHGEASTSAVEPGGNRQYTGGSLTTPAPKPPNVKRGAKDPRLLCQIPESAAQFEALYTPSRADNRGSSKTAKIAKRRTKTEDTREKGEDKNGIGDREKESDEKTKRAKEDEKKEVEVSNENEVEDTEKTKKRPCDTHEKRELKRDSHVGFQALGVSVNPSDAQRTGRSSVLSLRKTLPSSFHVKLSSLGVATAKGSTNQVAPASEDHCGTDSQQARPSSLRRPRLSTSRASISEGVATTDAPESSVFIWTTTRAAPSNRYARILVLMVFVFVLCLTPYFVFSLVHLLCDYVPHPAMMSCVDFASDVTLGRIVMWMSLANSLINPFLYPTFHKNYRRAFFQIASRCKHKCC